MEIPVVHDHSRPVKRPVVSPRNAQRPKPPPPPVRSASAAANSSGNGNGKTRGGVQTIPIQKVNEACEDQICTAMTANSAKSPRGNFQTSSASASPASSALKPATKTTTSAKSNTTSHFLKLATTRNPSGQKPKLPTKPAALKENPTLIYARKSGAVSGAAATEETMSPATSTVAASAPAATSSSEGQSLLSYAKNKEEISRNAIASESENLGKNISRFASASSSPGRAVGLGAEGKCPNQTSASLQTSLHARLPSTDSGIQADGGFDSLSRYKGKSFLSDSSATFDSLESSDNVVGNSYLSASAALSTVVDGDAVFIKDNLYGIENNFNESFKKKGICSGTSEDRNKQENESLGNADKRKATRVNSDPVAHNCQTLPFSKRSGKAPSKRPFSAPRPLNSPPPAPVSVAPCPASPVTTSIPVVKRPPRNRPIMPRPTRRHSAGPPSQGPDFLVESPSPGKAPSEVPSHPAVAPHKPFTRRNIKALRSTSLENFANILGEKLTAAVNLGNSRATHSMSSTERRDSGDLSSDKNTAQAFTLPRPTSKCLSSKPPTYMNVSPPPPPPPPRQQLSVASTSAPSCSAPRPLPNPCDESFPSSKENPEATRITTTSHPEATRITTTSHREVTTRAGSPPRLHPSIKTFTNHGPVHIARSKTSTVVTSNSPVTSVHNEPPISSSHLATISNTTQNGKITSYKDEGYSYKTNSEKVANSKLFLDKSEVQECKTKPDVEEKTNFKVGGNPNVALTRPLRIVAPPGKLNARALQLASRNHQLHDSEGHLLPSSKDSVGLKESKDERDKTSWTTSPGNVIQIGENQQQDQVRNEDVKPSVTLRPKMSLTRQADGNTVVSTSNDVLPMRQAAKSQNSQSASSSQPVVRPHIAPSAAMSSERPISCSRISNPTQLSISTSTASPNHIPALRLSSESPRSAAQCAPQQNSNELHRTEIPVTHLEISDDLRRFKDEVRRNADSARPVSSFFPHSPSFPASPSHPSTLPRNFSNKRDVRSPYRSLLSSRQGEESKSLKDAVYENVRMRVRDSFRFEDASSRFRHADLLLKETDDLMKEALDMLKNSPLPQSLSPSTFSSSPENQKLFSPSLSSLSMKDKYRPKSEGADPYKDQTTVPKSPCHVTLSPSASQTFLGAERNSGKDCNKNSTKESGSSPSRDYKNFLSDLNSSRDDFGTSIPFYDVRSGRFYGNGKDLTPVIVYNGVLPDKQKAEMTSPPPKERSSGAEVTWTERKAWIDSALSWLKTELVSQTCVICMCVCL